MKHTVTVTRSWADYGILGFLLVLLILACGPLGCGPSGQESKPPTSSEVTITPKATPKPTETKEATPEVAQVPVMKNKEGRRDPFIPVVFTKTKVDAPVNTEVKGPDGTIVKVSKTKVKEPVVPLTMTVTGIVNAGGRSYAAIDGVPNVTTISVGDKVGGFLVRSITANKVTLTKDGSPFIYTLQHPEDQPGQGVKGGGPGKAGAPPPPAPAP